MRIYKNKKAVIQTVAKEPNWIIAFSFLLLLFGLS